MNYGFRLGTTSYIIPADLIPNIEYLAGRVEDIELILFEVDDGPNNLPSEYDLRQMADLAAANHLTYTVHLPLDIDLGAVDRVDHPSLHKAVRVIERMNTVTPHAFVVHLVGKDVLRGRVEPEVWRDRTVAALEILGKKAGGNEHLAVENLEGYPLDFLEPVLERISVSCCVDVGHLWLDAHDALAFLRQHLHRTRVIHLHGIGTRDHQSVAHVPVDDLRAFLATLEEASYTGVVTLEVFDRDDLDSSLRALQQAGDTLHRRMSVSR